MNARPFCRGFSRDTQRQKSFCREFTRIDANGIRAEITQLPNYSMTQSALRCSCCVRNSQEPAHVELLGLQAGEGFSQIVGQFHPAFTVESGILRFLFED